MNKLLKLFLLALIAVNAYAQPGAGSHWTPDGNGFYTIKEDEIVLFDLGTQKEKTIVSKNLLTPAGSTQSLPVKDYAFSADQSKVLIFTNSKRVWRYETRGDYWVLDLKNNHLMQLGKGRPEASLMFAKFSPDGKNAAYVSERNVYVEDLANHSIKKLTSTDGNDRLINGTFDWAYEEEFDCRDGFRWSPDSRHIAYWQIDATNIRNFLMINNTDSIYAHNVPVEYPKVGFSPSACSVGVVDINNAKTTWMNVPGDKQQHYIPRLEWVNADQVMLQQLNRKQNTSKVFFANPKTGATTDIYDETDAAWVDVRAQWPTNETGWYWLKDRQHFLWLTEKDGWQHIYRISKDGKKQTLITKGNYDLIDPLAVDEQGGHIYFTASPDNATEKYLYRVRLDGNGNAERLTPAIQDGTHSYQISPNGRFAYHSFSNYYTAPMKEWVKLPSHEALNAAESIAAKFDPTKKAASNVSFFQVTTDDGITMDGWMAKPKNFDPTKKYPTVFYVYGEPAGQTVVNRWGTGKNGLYNGDMAEDGYIYVSVEGRGAPAPKGREWRKAIYKNIGIINIRDQAMANKKMQETYPFIDPERIAVHGWSGGGSSTLNLLFQYPDLYQTGISVAAVGNQLTYDNIYQERYMGVPPEDLDGFVQGSPVTHAKNLRGNLLYIHGTGDDNVHYQNAEMLVNELIKYNKQFQFMAYPNRSHGIYEGEGTRRHLNTLFTNYLKTHCPPGAK